jgi:hypothetical protein
MKVLYYPKLTLQDYQSLLDNFQIEYKKIAGKNRRSWVYSLLAFAGSWAVAYRLRLKFTSFLLLGATGFFGTYYGLNCLNARTMKKNLNGYARSLSGNYPEIKYSVIEYSKSGDLITNRI